jgi:amylosucrase
VQRNLPGHALIAGFSGIPLIYMGDELAMPNDDGYLSVPDHANDSRWSHRPMMDWTIAATRETGPGPAGQVFRGTRHILAQRRATAALHAAYPQQIIDVGLPGVNAHLRNTSTGPLPGV